ncbi:hypothetical protein Ae201684_003418 [Aphanomyces euteiches]|uniref:Uncharacterized protein n=1 Tax=Aphanomyces euteiches TaxID=100861 RepID=A0A6G0XLR7_9STRA|nr:hypothetical protein Ae201684_003418 [Aphanomyces euteiches]
MSSDDDCCNALCFVCQCVEICCACCEVAAAVPPPQQTVVIAPVQPVVIAPQPVTQVAGYYTKNPAGGVEFVPITQSPQHNTQTAHPTQNHDAATSPANSKEFRSSSLPPKQLNVIFEISTKSRLPPMSDDTGAALCLACECAYICCVCCQAAESASNPPQQTVVITHVQPVVVAASPANQGGYVAGYYVKSPTGQAQFVPAAQPPASPAYAQPAPFVPYQPTQEPPSYNAAQVPPSYNAAQVPPPRIPNNVEFGGSSMGQKV